MKAKKIIYIAIALWALTFTACRREELYEGPCEVSFTTSMQRELTVSRGYVPFPNDYEPFTSALIIANATLNNISPMEYSYDSNGNGQFTTKVRLEAGSYSVYGFMPWTDEGSFNSESERRVMTVPGIPTISQHDVMLIKHQALLINQDDKTKTVNLQMDHMMARVTPYFYLHDAYADMRTIKIKQVDFVQLDATDHTATVTYTNDGYDINWAVGAVTADTMATAYGAVDPDTLTKTKGEQAYGTFYYRPGLSTANLKMRVTYDVYDKVDDTKPIRENVVVENKIKQLPATLEDGTNYKLNIKVTPTYLYSLSDNDEQTLLIVD